MHESSIAQYVLDIIKSELEKDVTATNKKVLSITFLKGQPSHVSIESFEFYFEELIKGTLIEGAKLIYNDTDKEGFFIESIETED